MLSSTFLAEHGLHWRGFRRARLLLGGAIFVRYKHVGERYREISEAMRRGSWARSLIVPGTAGGAQRWVVAAALL
jgi:hypothetical protein